VNSNVEGNGAGARLSVREIIISYIEQISKEQRKSLRPLTDDLVLLDTGLDSLCLAILVARLDDKLGCDPFSAAADEQFPVTLRDFIGLYENAFN
jgi:acyl carrier protein